MRTVLPYFARGPDMPKVLVRCRGTVSSFGAAAWPTVVRAVDLLTEGDYSIVPPVLPGYHLDIPLTFQDIPVGHLPVSTNRHLRRQK